MKKRSIKRNKPENKSVSINKFVIMLLAEKIVLAYNGKLNFSSFNKKIESW